MSLLFTPVEIGSLRARNRLWVAPMCQYSSTDGMPNTWHLTHLSAFATGGAGLVMTEATAVSPEGRISPDDTGIWNDEQRDAWMPIAAEIRARGALAAIQLAHAGRKASTWSPLKAGRGSVSEADGGWHALAPSPIAYEGYAVPEQLDAAGIATVVTDFAAAARRSVEAGFDVLEVHAAHGYLLHEFLSPLSNHRTDEYGGSPVDRARFAVEVTRAVAEAVGPARVGIRISPAHNIQGATEEDADDVRATYTHLVEQLAPLGLAYLSVLADPRLPLVQDLRAAFGGVVIANDGFGEVTTLESAQAILDEDLADAVAVGRLFIANPDLPRRWAEGAGLNEPDSATFYGGGAEGYTDYPALGA